MRIPRAAERRAILLQHRVEHAEARADHQLEEFGFRIDQEFHERQGPDGGRFNSSDRTGYARLLHGGSLLAGLRPGLVTTRVPRAVRSRRSQISTVSGTSPNTAKTMSAGNDPPRRYCRRRSSYAANFNWGTVCLWSAHRWAPARQNARCEIRELINVHVGNTYTLVNCDASLHRRDRLCFHERSPQRERRGVLPAARDNPRLATLLEAALAIGTQQIVRNLPRGVQSLHCVRRVIARDTDRPVNGRVDPRPVPRFELAATAHSESARSCRHVQRRITTISSRRRVSPSSTLQGAASPARWSRWLRSVTADRYVETANHWAAVDHLQAASPAPCAAR